MDPTLLTALISIGAALITSILHKYVTAPAPASPTPAPTVTPPAAPVAAASPVPSLAPSPTSASPADPFAGLPGLPGHPVLNLLAPWLQSLLSGPSSTSLTAADQAQNQAAATALAGLLRANPVAHSAVASALGATPK